MERVILKKLTDISGFNYNVKSLKLGKNNIVLAPNSFGKTSIVNAITERYLENKHIDKVEIQIEENGIIYSDLNVIRFSGDTLINSLSIGEEVIDVGYEIVRKNNLKNDIEDLEERLSESRNVIQTMFGYSSAQVLSKITGVRSGNVVLLCRTLISEHHIPDISYNADLYDDLKRIYKDFQNGLDNIFRNLNNCDSNELNDICNIIDYDFKQEVKKYLIKMQQHGCDLPITCPLCEAFIDDWDRIKMRFYSLDFPINQNNSANNLMELINAEFESSSFIEMRNEILSSILNNNPVNVSELLSELKVKIIQQIIYQLNLSGFNEIATSLNDKKNELSILNSTIVSEPQLLQIKERIERELMIFNKDHILVSIDEGSLRFTMIDTDITVALSESERNLISLIYFRNFIEFNTLNSFKKTIILFDDPVDSYDESFFPEITSMIIEIISTNFSIIFTHSLIALETFQYVNSAAFKYYYFYKTLSSVKLISIDKKEIKALNQFGGDYGLVDYWIKQRDLKPKTELLILGAVPILRNVLEFTYKFFDKCSNENDSSNPRKVSTEMKGIYQSICNNVSHYRVTGSRNISFVENNYIEVYEKVISRRRHQLFDKIGSFSIIDYIVKDIIANKKKYQSNRPFSDLILYRFVVMLFVKRTIEFNLIYIARNLSLSIGALTTKHTLSSQYNFIQDSITNTDIDYDLFQDLLSYKNRYLNFINSMSHSSNRIIPPFLMMEEIKLNNIINDLKLIDGVNLIC